MALTHCTVLVSKQKRPLSSTLGENPAAKTKGESRIKWPKSVASHGNGLIISTTTDSLSNRLHLFLLGNCWGKTTMPCLPRNNKHPCGLQEVGANRAGKKQANGRHLPADIYQRLNVQR
jgi:hypothetical protein